MRADISREKTKGCGYVLEDNYSIVILGPVWVAQSCYAIQGEIWTWWNPQPGHVTSHPSKSSDIADLKIIRDSSKQCYWIDILILNLMVHILELSHPSLDADIKALQSIPLCCDWCDLWANLETSFELQTKACSWLWSLLPPWTDSAVAFFQAVLCSCCLNVPGLIRQFNLSRASGLKGDGGLKCESFSQKFPTSTHSQQHGANHGCQHWPRPPCPG